MTWTVGDYSFHVVALKEKGRSGNSPSLTVIAKGVFHTHLGRKIILSHGEEATTPLPFDIADDVLKSTLEDLISIDSVNVSKIVYGQTGDSDSEGTTPSISTTELNALGEGQDTNVSFSNLVEISTDTGRVPDVADADDANANADADERFASNLSSVTIQ